MKLSTVAYVGSRVLACKQCQIAAQAAQKTVTVDPRLVTVSPDQS